MNTNYLLKLGIQSISTISEVGVIKSTIIFRYLNDKYEYVKTHNNKIDIEITKKITEIERKEKLKERKEKLKQLNDTRFHNIVR